MKMLLLCLPEQEGMIKMLLLLRLRVQWGVIKMLLLCWPAAAFLA